MVIAFGSLQTFRMVCRHARRMFLVGEFNHWSHTAHEMHHLGDDRWEITLTLSPGTYRFRYLTDDGRWLTDYAAFGLHPNRSGGWDSVVFVPENPKPALV